MSLLKNLTLQVRELLRVSIDMLERPDSSQMILLPAVGILYGQTPVCQDWTASAWLHAATDHAIFLYINSQKLLCESCKQRYLSCIVP